MARRFALRLTTRWLAPVTAMLLIATGANVAVARPSESLATWAAMRAASIRSAHFAIGARDLLRSNGQLAWAPQTGIPFDSVYEYVSGSGPGTPGDFATSTIVAFARTAHADGYLPVLSYFRLDGDAFGPASTHANCTGTCIQGDTAKRNLDHLADAGFMHYFFADLISTLRALNTDYHGPVIIHLEPDLSGYGQMLVDDRTRCGTDCLASVPKETPAAVIAAVASSGTAQLAGYPNTMQGFFLAVLHLRDLYAPRVALAYHVSTWATADMFRVHAADQTANDISRGTVAVNTAWLADRVAAFAAADGASSHHSSLPGPATSSYDVLFNDVLDHDAAYFELARHDPHFWWDSENVDLPNFARWESYLHRIDTDTHLPVMAWQVPVGNTVYKTEDDTFGHYQDNRVQYIFNHIAELARAGIIGVIFGAGNADSTSNLDRRRDGVTAGHTTCTTQGTHTHTRACTWKTSHVRDDDGGYLRDRAAAYFAHPYSLT
jgi:hypothetical protein